MARVEIADDSALNALLDRVEAPSPFWAAVACLAFILWIGAAFAFVFQGLDEELRLQRRRALPWAVVVLVGLALWVVGLLLA